MLKRLLLFLTAFLFAFGIKLNAQEVLSVADSPLYTISQPSWTHLLGVKPSDSEAWVGYWSGVIDKHLALVGVQQVPMEYGIASGYLAGSSLMEGKTIEGIRFMLNQSSHIENVKVWVSTSLPKIPEEADICCQKVEAVKGLNEVRFDKPYRVHALKPVYVGYSFKVTQGSSDEEKYPIVFSTENNVPNALLVQVGDGGWYDYYSKGFGVAAMQVLISGDLHTGGVEMNPTLGEMVSLREGCKIPLALENYTVDGVEDLKVSIDVGGVVTEEHVVLPEKVTKLGEQFLVEATVAVPQTPAAYTYTAKILAVNGQELSLPLVGEGPLYVISDSVSHKVVVEEFTGMWCGHCPRGMVGLQKLHDLYGDDVVLIAVHSNDAIECSDYADFVARTVSGFPLAHVDRSLMGVDPYLGFGSSFGINDCVLLLKDMLPLAEVKAVPMLKGDVLTAGAEVSFLYSGSEDYALGYVLLEDGMHHDKWLQSNYLSGDTELLKEDPLFEPWVNAGRKRLGVVFNEVAIAAQGIETGIPGSIPASFECGQQMVHEVEFDLAKYQKIQDRERLRLAVILFDQRTGSIINADVKPVAQDPTGFENQQLAEEDDVMAYYTLDGRQIAVPQRGLVLVKYASGRVQRIYVK